MHVETFFRGGKKKKNKRKVLKLSIKKGQIYVDS